MDNQTAAGALDTTTSTEIRRGHENTHSQISENSINLHGN